jgi:hypothetical protein
MIAREGGLQAGLGRQVRSRRAYRLDTGFFAARSRPVPRNVPGQWT